MKAARVGNRVQTARHQTTFDTGVDAFNPMMPSNVKLLPYLPAYPPACHTVLSHQPPSLAVGRRSGLAIRSPDPQGIIGCASRSYEFARHCGDDKRVVSGRLIDIYA
jgi:hypothetical protein